MTTAAPPVQARPTDDLIRASVFEVREDAAGDGEGRGPLLAGHLAVFDTWTRVDSWWEGVFMERIAPGAFKKTMREQRDAIKVTFNHGHDVLGDQVLGPIEVLREDEVGAYYEVALLDGIPELLMAGLRAGTYGASFRFSVVKESTDEEPGASDYNPSGLPERTIKEVKLFEFGPVTFPAYAEATAGVRAVVKRYEADPERLRAVLLEVLDTSTREQEQGEGALAEAVAEPALAESREQHTTEQPARTTAPAVYPHERKDQPRWLL